MDEKEKELQELYRRAIFIPMGPRAEEPDEAASEEQEKEEKDKDRKNGQSA
ncbi:hypothetical protein [Tepidiforma thermophila]|uniref:Uncharacterized protein n=1 Tax=Tepidiforma thermophila (strain KCTC 52669 / CGMCC 1.13589 / G233) TaxID=2761530 RepID=A0A2A9HJE0_TEPT2|nr:hypothetical protein [Tepidiforma thermophila]PFG75155.1 hypothetical protein A9A59_2421 [Tepidiforma thermophila]